ncbi:MAG: LuxR family transcriptional regulator, partial [Sphingomonas sp.]
MRTYIGLLSSTVLAGLVALPAAAQTTSSETSAAPVAAPAADPADGD